MSDEPTRCPDCGETGHLAFSNHYPCGTAESPLGGRNRTIRCYENEIDQLRQQLAEDQQREQADRLAIGQRELNDEIDKWRQRCERAEAELARYKQRDSSTEGEQVRYWTNNNRTCPYVWKRDKSGVKVAQRSHDTEDWRLSSLGERELKRQREITRDEAYRILGWEKPEGHQETLSDRAERKGVVVGGGSDDEIDTATGTVTTTPDQPAGEPAACPWCGAHASNRCDSDGIWRVVCSASELCGAQGPWTEHKTNAVILWNRIAQQPAATPCQCRSEAESKADGFEWAASEAEKKEGYIAVYAPERWLWHAISEHLNSWARYWNRQVEQQGGGDGDDG